MPLLSWSGQILPPLLIPVTYNIIVLFWGSKYKWYFGSTFPKMLCFKASRVYQRHNYCWLEDSSSCLETVNHQQYPDGLWLGLVTIAYTWGISRFCSWFIQLWLSWLKRKNLTKHKTSLHHWALHTQLCTNWSGDSYVTSSWGCPGVALWGWVNLSFPLVLCRSTGLQEPL